MKSNGKIKMMTLDQLKDEHIGKVGTVERDEYELDLKVEVLGESFFEVGRIQSLKVG